MIDADNSWNWFSTWSHVDLDALSSKAFITYLLADKGGDTYNGRLVIWKCIDPADTCPASIADFSALPGDTADNMESYAEKKIVVAVN